MGRGTDRIIMKLKADIKTSCSVEGSWDLHASSSKYKNISKIQVRGVFLNNLKTNTFFDKTSKIKICDNIFYCSIKRKKEKRRTVIVSMAEEGEMPEKFLQFLGSKIIKNTK